jgi:23S rRNA (uracil1939-C5)-methyltransferase
MTLKKGQLIELDITQIAFGGRGLTRLDGMAVFVDGSVPGDRVLARIVKKKKSFAEARAIEILAASPQRVQAPCPYSGYCGGCKWQFLDYAHQLIYKQQHVREALEHIGMIRDVPVHPTLPSDNIFGYRNKMEFSCATRRWLLPAELERPDVEAGMALGLHVPGTFDKVLDIEACLIQPDLGNQILGDVRRYIQASPFPVYGLRTHEGFWRFLVLRHSVAHQHWMVNIVTAALEREHIQPLADMLMAKYPQVVSVVNNVTSSKAGVAVGQFEVVLAGDALIHERIGDFDFELSANSFFQTNTLGARRLYDTVARYAALTGRETLLDLYSGTGTIAIYLSAGAKTVVGLEVVAGAVDDAQRNCRRNGVENCRFIAGDIRRTLPQLDVRPEVMIIDPPRSGMHADVVAQVMVSGPPKIVYVSCNPATLARDLAMMKDAYDVVEVQPMDMFPHTFHIEAVALLKQKERGSIITSA